jgi:hypothetical protein
VGFDGIFRFSYSLLIRGETKDEEHEETSQ